MMMLTTTIFPLSGWLSFLSEKVSELIFAKNEPPREAKLNEVLLYHDNMIKRICFGYSDSHEAMQDLYQDVMLNIWTALPSFRGEASLKTWTYRIALNTCVSTIRRLQRRDQYEQIEKLVEQAVADEDNKEMLVELHQVISQLSPVDKAIVLMWLDEVSYEDIASTIGLPRNTVATRLRRAKDKIKEKFTI